ncbi:MAG TPA: hypothetical protein VLB44_16025 [Kofleriaceae bacterium]|nr:hypothetical protein [Kofleriaceae bacterium]
MTAASRICIGLVTVVAGCAAPSALDVSPGEAADASGGKADGNTPKTELKVTIDPSQIARARSRLSLQNANSQTRRIWFFDTPALDLYEAGVIVRAREIDGDGDDSTIKLRPFTEAQLASSFRKLDELKCETDRDITKATPACSLGADQDEGEILAVDAGVRAIDQLYSSEQEDLFAVYGPDVALEALEALGPIPARVWTVRSHDLPEKLTAELWYMPDGSQSLELSMRVDTSDADDGLDDLLGFVDDRGLDLSDEQESKTRRALDSFASQP